MEVSLFVHMLLFDLDSALTRTFAPVMNEGLTFYMHRNFRTGQSIENS